MQVVAVGLHSGLGDGLQVAHSLRSVVSVLKVDVPPVPPSALETVLESAAPSSSWWRRASREQIQYAY